MTLTCRICLSGQYKNRISSRCCWIMTTRCRVVFAAHRKEDNGRPTPAIVYCYLQPWSPCRGPSVRCCTSSPQINKSKAEAGFCRTSAAVCSHRRVFLWFGVAAGLLLNKNTLSESVKTKVWRRAVGSEIRLDGGRGRRAGPEDAPRSAGVPSPASLTLVQVGRAPAGPRRAPQTFTSVVLSGLLVLLFPENRWGVSRNGEELHPW